MNNAHAPIPATVDMRRRDQIRAQRQRARCSNVDLLAERHPRFGFKNSAKPLAYTTNMPKPA